MTNKRNPYLDHNGNPLLRRSVVAFIDILGYTDWVVHAEASGAPRDFLVSLRDALLDSVKSVDEELREDSKIFPVKFAETDRYRVHTFTDSILIGFPIQDDAEMELGSLFWKLGFFQLAMVNRGFFLRGAISIGDLFMDETIIFGGGLIEAYQGERKLARDPRIILTDSAATAVKTHLTYYSSAERSPQARDLFVDADGQYFLNYLDTVLVAEVEQGPFYEDLEKHKKSIETRLDQFRSQPSVWSKYAWVGNYHNFFCDQHSYFSDQHKVDLSKFHMSPTRIA